MTNKIFNLVDFNQSLAVSQQMVMGVAQKLRSSTDEDQNKIILEKLAQDIVYLFEKESAGESSCHRRPFPRRAGPGIR